MPTQNSRLINLLEKLNDPGYVEDLETVGKFVVATMLQGYFQPKSYESARKILRPVLVFKGPLIIRKGENHYELKSLRNEYDHRSFKMQFTAEGDWKYSVMDLNWDVAHEKEYEKKPFIRIPLLDFAPFSEARFY